MRIIILIIISANSFAGIDLKHADELASQNLKESEKELLSQLNKVENNSEKCEVLWRLARVYLLMGEPISSKDEKRPYYTKGKQYAEEAIKANPNNPQGYMWHSANVGREGQTKGIKDQIAIVPIVTGDLSSIFDKIHVLNLSEAWQALSEMYYKHPFKSNDAAENYARKAIMCIPANEARLTSYAYFAELLYNRGDSASKRKSMIDDYVEKFKKNYDSNIDKYGYFEGSLGSSYIPKWSKKSLGSMSDKEEALDIVNYAINIYKNLQVKTKDDEKDYNTLLKYKKEWE